MENKFSNRYDCFLFWTEIELYWSCKYHDYIFVDITLNQYADAADTQKLRVSKGAANAIQTEGIYW